MIRRAPLPLGFVRVPRVTYQSADDNKSRCVHPMRPRRGRAGITRFDAPALWAAINRGEFPAPVVGDFGAAWSLEAVNQWRRRNAATARKRANVSGRCGGSTAAALGGPA